MAFSAIQLKPGVNTIQTPTLNQGGISKSNLIRFRQGLVEKMGGWTKFDTVSTGSITRCLHAWQGLTGDSYLLAGNVSSAKFYGLGTVLDVTPEYLVTTPAMNVTTTIGTSTVTIIDASLTAPLSIYSAVFFNTPVTIGGVVLTGFYQVASAGATGTYTINSGQIATATVSNAGATPSFTTASGSPTITVTFANHGLTLGQKFNFPIPTIVGGITINGVVTPTSITSTSVFVFTAPTIASATDTRSMGYPGITSGSPQFKYYLNIGPGQSQQYGALGAIGEFAIGQGLAYTASAATQTGTAITATDWSEDNWGEIVLACPKGGPIFYWNPNAGFNTMIPIGAGPASNNGIFVSMPQQILVAWGSASTLVPGNANSSMDPLLVRWSDQLDFTQWQVTSATQAGSFHIPTGSEIRGGIQGAGGSLIFTDIDVWIMNYLGYPLVFGFDQIYTSGGLLGQHAVVSMRGATYWMSVDNFFTTSGKGGVSIIPCSVWDNVFQDLDTDNAYKVCAAANSGFSEVIWFYPSIADGTGENSRYVKFNAAEGVWDYGVMPRSAWVPQSVLGQPIGADPTSTYLYQHEMTYGADGDAMDSYIETGYTAVGDGENFSMIDHFEPDMKFTTINSSTPDANIAVTLTTQGFPNETGVTYGPLTMSSTVSYLTPRLRGRQLKWRLGTNDATSWWRQGNIRYRYNIDGRR